jgi:cholesterol oxidase
MRGDRHGARADLILVPDEDWFIRRRDDGSVEQWPVTRADLEPHYDQVEAVLAPQQYPFGSDPYDKTPKTLALKEAAQALGLQWFLPSLAVTFANPGEAAVPGEPIKNASGHTPPNLHHRSRTTCRLCGECDIGCNYGSKNTLDYTHLTLAENKGAVLRDRCEVRRFAPRAGGGYTVSYVAHLPEHEGRPTDTGALPRSTVSADRLVLAAGTFGTSFLLLKNRDNFTGLSGKLGHYFSGNGDFLRFVHDAHEDVDGARRTRTLAASHGSVITSTIRVPRHGDKGGFYIQDGGYPGFVDWLVEATNGLGLLHRAARFAETRVLEKVRGAHDPAMDAQIEAVLGDAHRSSSLLPLLAMGLDTPDGVLSLDDRNEQLRVAWSSRSSRAYFAEVESTMCAIASELGARFQVDPLWYLHHKVVTVHPVGGCSMGNSSDEGVVDRNGEVFGYPGFVIADGSVMPGPVGPNPSLTIAALANRFADHQIG